VSRFTSTDLPRALWLGLGLIVAATGMLVALEIYRTYERTPSPRQSADLVVRTFEVITGAQRLFQEVQAAQRAVRAYVNVRKPEELAAYRARSQAALALLGRLKQLTADNPEQQRRMPNIQLQIDAWFAELDRIVRIGDTRGAQAAQEILQSNAPLDAMRAIGGLIDAAVNSEKELLTQRLNAMAEEQERRAAQALLGAGLAFIILAAGVLLVPLAFYRVRGAERARQESDQRFRLFVNGVRDYAIYPLDSQGHVTDWNAGAERVKGYPAQEIVGQHFGRFYSEEDRLAGRPEQALQAAARDGSFEEEGWRLRKDGTRFLADTVLNAIRDPGGRLVGYMKITRDIGELRHQQLALAQYSKMEALGQLTGGLAHDFNNLLHVIKNGAELVERHLRDVQPQVRTYLDMVKRNADRAASLTQRLLAFARRQPLDPKPINPNTLIADVTALLKQALGESVAIETVVGGGLWTISADSNQLETAILNLALNARDAMPAGGKLTIEISNTFLDESYCAAHEEVKPGQYVMIAVSDNGAGMTGEVLAKAFDPFFTTKEPGRGTGLGLSQVYGFTKQSGGHVKIYSEAGSGTTVRLYLPRVPGTIESPVQHRTTEPAPGRMGRETLVLVEDDDDVRDFTAEVLRELGYRVLAAGDAESALGLLQGEPKVELLFTDIGLPGGVNGRQLAHEAVKRWPRLKVLFTTGYARNAIIHQGRLDEGVELITKPFTQSRLARKIRQVLDAREPA
jgi:PAS domain S-box-containing protein